MEQNLALFTIWIISGMGLFVATVMPPYSKRDLLILFPVFWFGLAFLVWIGWFQRFFVQHMSLAVHGTSLPIYLVLAYWLWADLRKLLQEYETKFLLRPFSAIIHLPLLHWVWWGFWQALASNSC